MRILILDDDQLRHDVFGKRYAAHVLTHVFTVSAFRKALDENRLT